MIDADRQTFVRAQTLVLDCLKIITGETSKTVPSQTTVVWKLKLVTLKKMRMQV
jgi:hypothetical protein